MSASPHPLTSKLEPHQAQPKLNTLEKYRQAILAEDAHYKNISAERVICEAKIKSIKDAWLPWSKNEEELRQLEKERVDLVQRETQSKELLATLEADAAREHERYQREEQKRQAAVRQFKKTLDGIPSMEAHGGQETFSFEELVEGQEDSQLKRNVVYIGPAETINAVPNMRKYKIFDMHGQETAFYAEEAIYEQIQNIKATRATRKEEANLVATFTSKFTKLQEEAKSDSKKAVESVTAYLKELEAIIEEIPKPGSGRTSTQKSINTTNRKGLLKLQTKAKHLSESLPHREEFHQIKVSIDGFKDPNLIDAYIKNLEVYIEKIAKIDFGVRAQLHDEQKEAVILLDAMRIAQEIVIKFQKALTQANSQLEIIQNKDNFLAAEIIKIKNELIENKVRSIIEELASKTEAEVAAVARKKRSHETLGLIIRQEISGYRFQILNSSELGLPNQQEKNTVYVEVNPHDDPQIINSYRCKIVDKFGKTHCIFSVNTSSQEHAQLQIIVERKKEVNLFKAEFKQIQADFFGAKDFESAKEHIQQFELCIEQLELYMEKVKNPDSKIKAELSDTQKEAEALLFAMHSAKEIIVEFQTDLAQSQSEFDITAQREISNTKMRRIENEKVESRVQELLEKLMSEAMEKAAIADAFRKRLDECKDQDEIYEWNIAFFYAIKDVKNTAVQEKLDKIQKSLLKIAPYIVNFNSIKEKAHFVLEPLNSIDMPVEAVEFSILKIDECIAEIQSFITQISKLENEEMRAMLAQTQENATILLTKIRAAQEIIIRFQKILNGAENETEINEQKEFFSSKEVSEIKDELIVNKVRAILEKLTTEAVESRKSVDEFREELHLMNKEVEGDIDDFISRISAAITKTDGTVKNRLIEIKDEAQVWKNLLLRQREFEDLKKEADLALAADQDITDSLIEKITVILELLQSKISHYQDKPSAVEVTQQLVEIQQAAKELEAQVIQKQREQRTLNGYLFAPMPVSEETKLSPNVIYISADGRCKILNQEDAPFMLPEKIMDSARFPAQLNERDFQSNVFDYLTDQISERNSKKLVNLISERDGKNTELTQLRLKLEKIAIEESTLEKAQSNLVQELKQEQRVLEKTNKDLTQKIKELKEQKIIEKSREEIQAIMTKFISENPRFAKTTFSFLIGLFYNDAHLGNQLGAILDYMNDHPKVPLSDILGRFISVIEEFKESVEKRTNKLKEGIEDGTDEFKRIVEQEAAELREVRELELSLQEIRTKLGPISKGLISKDEKEVIEKRIWELSKTANNGAQPRILAFQKKIQVSTDKGTKLFRENEECQATIGLLTGRISEISTQIGDLENSLDALSSPAPRSIVSQPSIIGSEVVDANMSPSKRKPVRNKRSSPKSSSKVRVPDISAAETYEDDELKVSIMVQAQEEAKKVQEPAKKEAKLHASFSTSDLSQIADEELDKLGAQRLRSKSVPSVQCNTPEFSSDKIPQSHSLSSEQVLAFMSSNMPSPETSPPLSPADKLAESPKQESTPREEPVGKVKARLSFPMVNSSLISSSKGSEPKDQSQQQPESSALTSPISSALFANKSKCQEIETEGLQDVITKSSPWLANIMG